MPRNLLVQWTRRTIRDEEKLGSHGLGLWAAPSSKARLMECEPGDRVFIACVIGGALLPVCRLDVERVATREELEDEGADVYPLPFQAVAHEPLPRMNLRRPLPAADARRVRKASGERLASDKRHPSRVSGQAFREPQWISDCSADLLTSFLDAVWAAEEATGLDDPARVARGLAPQLTHAERRAIELHAMSLAERHYRMLGFNRFDDTSAGNPYDLRARNEGGDEVHIEVKGTTGDGAAVIVTAGEVRHATEFPRAALAVVSHIELQRGRRPSARGGDLAVLDPWKPAADHLKPTVYRYEPSWS